MQLCSVLEQQLQREWQGTAIRQLLSAALQQQVQSDVSECKATVNKCKTTSANASNGSECKATASCAKATKSTPSPAEALYNGAVKYQGGGPHLLRMMPVHNK